MEPLLIGYFPKKRQPVPEWFSTAIITRICSVSECIVPGPDNWIDQWQHNDLLLFDDPQRARLVVPTGSAETFDIYEYRAFPFYIDRHVRKHWDLSIVVPTAIDDELLDVLGYDMVSRSTACSFECSPLSCNGMADEWPTNEFCLIDDAKDAIDYADKLCDGNAEPGPYCVVRVALVAPND